MVMMEQAKNKLTIGIPYSWRRTCLGRSPRLKAMKQNFSSSKPRRGSPFDLYKSMASELKKNMIQTQVQTKKANSLQKRRRDQFLSWELIIEYIWPYAKIWGGKKRFHQIQRAHLALGGTGIWGKPCRHVANLSFASVEQNDNIFQCYPKDNVRHVDTAIFFKKKE